MRSDRRCPECGQPVSRRRYRAALMAHEMLGVRDRLAAMELEVEDFCASGVALARSVHAASHAGRPSVRLIRRSKRWLREGRRMRLSRGPLRVAARSGRGRIRCRLKRRQRDDSLFACGGQPGRSFNRPSQPISASGPACPSRSGGNRSALWRFHGGDGDKPDFLCDVWSCLLVARSRFRDQTEASCDRPPTKSSRPSQASESARADGPRPDSRGPNQRGDRRLAASRSFDREAIRFLDHVETRSPHSSRGGPASEQGGRFPPPDRRAHVRLRHRAEHSPLALLAVRPPPQIPGSDA